MISILFLLKDYSMKRYSFGKALIYHESHKIMLDKLQFILEGCVVLNLELSKITGESYENLQKINFKDLRNSFTNNTDLENYKKYSFLENILRMLLPISKMYCGRKSELFCLESIQSFGAVGYMEDSFIPGLLRDTMATAIWEGSFNTLSMEFFKHFENKEMIKILYDFLINNINNFDLQNLIKETFTIISEIPKSLRTEACFLICELLITSLTFKNDIEKEQKLFIYWLKTTKNSLFIIKQTLLQNPKF